MYLVIAEKPSLARNIVAGIESFANTKLTRRDGYFAGGDYLVTWAFGHLFSLCDVEDYTPSATGKWSLDNIPCFPETFRFNLRRGADKKPDAGIIKQFDTIKSLCNRPDVDTIVNAGDSDREGEIIVRLCISHALTGKKRLTRLWMPDQTPETIKKAFSEMKDEAEYDNLANEGFARTYIDWLYGVNLTRYATLRSGSLLRVGRVIVPIVKAIYDRDMAIEHFVPDKYYAIVSAAETGGERIELTSKQKFSKDQLAAANALCAKYNGADTVVTAVKSKKETVNPGKLFSLSKLQNFLGKKYKMSMEDSLSTVQKLYEDGYVTYPRTNSEYLATAEQDKVKAILATVKKMNYPVEFKNKKTIFDDSKIESHSALTPTYKIPNPAHLTDREKQVYSAIFRRFVAVFCAEDCIAAKTEIKISNGFEEFTLKGSVILEPGWTKYDDFTQKDKILPKLAKGDRVNVAWAPTEKETSPPKHYTIETLNNYLKNPFREEKAAEAENDDEEYRAIFEGLELGTEATRTGIIDNACKSNYIALKKDVYHLLPGGKYLIESLSRMQISMDKYKTSEMGRALKKVFRGEITVSDSVDVAKNEIRQVFHTEAQPPETDTDIGYFGEEVGKCPLCGGTVTRTKFGYGCNNYREKNCRFSINQVICSRVISPANVRLLLSQGTTSKIQGFISKNGKPFDAILVLEGDRVVFRF